MDISNIDVEFLLDKSGSMSTKDCAKGKQTRWEYGRETLVALANMVGQHDQDGITVCPFARKFKVYENVTAGGDKIELIYKENNPMGGTDTAGVLEDRLNAYFARKTAGTSKPIVLFVMTDGTPDDPDAVINAIISATNKMDDDSEIAISFVQVGNDADATAFLRKLDDDLVSKGAKFDIVDTLPIDEIEELTIEELIEKAFTD